MPVKFTRPRFVSTREIPAPSDPWDAFKENVEACRQRFRGRPVTPQSTLEFENELQALAEAVCRQTYEDELNRLEPDDKKAMPNKVRYHKETYRLNKKTPLQVASKFGMITLRSFYYLNEQDGEPGLHPLRVRLGIGAGSATPALLERVAPRVGRSHPGRGACLAVTRARPDLVQRSLACGGWQDFARRLLPFVPGLQKARLLAWLKQAENSRGRHRPVLAAGRNGIMIPMRSGGYEKPSTATVSVYDRRRRRLGTIYVGQMPEAKQATLSGTLTQLLRATLEDWHGPLPRLAYITDKGSACDE